MTYEGKPRYHDCRTRSEEFALKQIQNDVIRKLASMTELGILKWKRRDEDNLRWIKMKSLKIVMPMDEGADEMLIETKDGAMIVKGGTPALKEAISGVEREVE